MQMVILVAILALLLGLLYVELGGFAQMLADLPAERRQTLDFTHHGLGDGYTFAFWPMLLGGFFLYVSYYGCDQSQVQRELCARNIDDSRQSLFLNGVLRFPVVLLYCMVGVGIGAYAVAHPEFVTQLPVDNGEPNYNLVVPLYMLRNLPVGLVGLALVALFAAAMSSLDSVINSLSASTMEDFARRFHRGEWSDTKELLLSRLVTFIWGGLAIGFSFFVGDVAQTVLVAINKIGSLVNGPVLGVFALGLLTKRANGPGAISGLLAGFLFNLGCWLFLPDVSWLWWNVFGFVVTFLIGYGISCFRAHVASGEYAYQASSVSTSSWKGKYLILFVWSVALILFLWWLE